MKSPCEICHRKRFKDEVPAYTLDGMNFFTQRPIVRKLPAIGLDYITLGQPLSTLSGGECQRIKLASERHKEGSAT